MRTWRDVYYRIRSWVICTSMPMWHRDIIIGKNFKITNSVINYRGGALSIGDGFFMN